MRATSPVLSGMTLALLLTTAAAQELGEQPLPNAVPATDAQIMPTLSRRQGQVGLHYPNERGPVHGWIVFQAWKLIQDSPGGIALRDYVKTDEHSPLYDRDFADQNEKWADVARVDGEVIGVNSGGDEPLRDPDDPMYAPLLEGAWEEDVPVCRSVDHFWDPDAGFDAGLTGPILAFCLTADAKSALEAAQDRWSQALANWNQTPHDPIGAVYWLGRTAHLLADMSVPAHVHLDCHVPVVCSGGKDSYEEFTKTHYSEVDATKAIRTNDYALSSDYYLPGNFDRRLAALFYASAKKAKEFDSDSYPGTSSEYGKGKFNTARIPKSSGSYPTGNFPLTKTIDRVEWNHGGSSRALTELVDYAKRVESGDYHVYFYKSFWDKVDWSDTLNVMFTDGSSETFFDVDNANGDVFQEPLCDIYQPELEARAIGYTAALFQLFWQETHVTVTASAGEGGTVSPLGASFYSKGDSIQFQAQPNAGYAVDWWELDGSRVQQGVTSWTLANVQADHTVRVTFWYVGEGPVLSNGGVVPSAGYTTDTFTYSVHYYDPSGLAPVASFVGIDGSVYDMTLVPGSGTAANGSYQYSTSGLEAGAHKYAFGFLSGGGSLIALPSKGAFDGPTVNTRSPGGEKCCFVKVQWCGEVSGHIYDNVGGDVIPVPDPFARFALGERLWFTGLPAFGWGVSRWEQKWASPEWVPLDTTNAPSSFIDVSAEGHAVRCVFRRQDPTQRILKIEVIGPGRLEPGPGVYARPFNSLVDVTATPQANARFLGWTLDGTPGGSDTTLRVTMDGDLDKELKAAFGWNRLAQYTNDLPCIADTYILENNPAGVGRNTGRESELYVYYPQDGDTKSSLLKFDVSALPDDAVVTNVSLRFWCLETPDECASLEVQKVLEPWPEDDCTFIPRRTYTVWDSEPRYELGQPGPLEVALSDLHSEWKDWVQECLSGQNYGLLVREAQFWMNANRQMFHNNREWRFYSREYAEADKRPVLRVAYLGRQVVPEISVEPESFSLQVVKGLAATNLSLALLNGGEGTLVYTASSSTNWLEVLGGRTGTCSTNETKQITLGLSLSGLSAGDHLATLAIVDENAGNSPLNVPVRLVILGSVIEASPPNVATVTPEGADPAPAVVSVWNSGHATLVFAMGSSASWLELSPPTGTSTGEVRNIDLSFRAAGLTPGFYSDTLVVTNLTGDSPSLSIPVSLTVLARVAAPIFSPSGNQDLHRGAVEVTLSTPTLGATIHYTLDGTAPTESSPTYQGSPLTLDRTTLLRARAWKAGILPSDESAATYRIAYVIAASPTPLEGGTTTGSGTYDSAGAVTVTAAPNPGYRFVNWTENGNEVSQDADYTFPVSSNRTLVARFSVLPPLLRIRIVNGQPEVSVHGTVGTTHIVQYLIELKEPANWLELTEVTLRSSPYVIIDTNTDNARFYRTVSSTNLPPAIRPMINIQPQNLKVAAGRKAAFTVAAAGTEPFAYQWRKDSTNLVDWGRISGATTATLTIANCQASDAGSYDVIVTNAAGAVTSEPAVLTVADLASGLVAYYPMNGNANDESGKGHNGTVVGAALTTDRYGNANGAFSFDGQSDRLVINPFSGFPSTAVSASFWMKCGSMLGKDLCIISYAVAENDNAFALAASNPSFRLLIQNGNDNQYSIQSPVSADDGQWHHIVVTWKSADGQVRIYKDGVLAWTAQHGMGRLITSTGCLGFGEDQDTLGGRWGDSFVGQLDDVRIYDRALSVDEVAVLYAAEGIAP